MSADLRRGFAYFGCRERVYTHMEFPEFDGLPCDWRRQLCTSQKSPVVGPFGNVFPTIDHALMAFRFMYTSNNPALTYLFRSEHSTFHNMKLARRWSDVNGMSLLMCDPDARLWIIVRDRCMFDLVFQRICRDETYRKILSTLIKHRVLPVYHVRTATDQTYWGAIMDKSKFTPNKVSNVEDCELMVEEAYHRPGRDVSCNKLEYLVGRNRLGCIMKEAMCMYDEVYNVGMPLRIHIPSMESTHLPAIPISPIETPELEKSNVDLDVSQSSKKRRRVVAQDQDLPSPKSSNFTGGKVRHVGGLSIDIKGITANFTSLVESVSEEDIDLVSKALHRENQEPETNHANTKVEDELFI